MAPHLRLIACFALPVLVGVSFAIASAFTDDAPLLRLPPVATIAAVAFGMFVIGAAD